jgi:hypothetical protein
MLGKIIEKLQEENIIMWQAFKRTEKKSVLL